MVRSRSCENNVLNTQDLVTKLEKDKSTFITKIRESDMSKISTLDFWMKNQSSMPHLCNLARKLLCILSSSACIERYFSICGVTCSNRRGNIKPEMIRKRSLLKVNLGLIEDVLVWFNLHFIYTLYFTLYNIFLFTLIK